MHIVYSTQRGNFERGVRYENPKFFEKLPEGVKSATIIGDWPKVKQACESAGVKIEGNSAPKPKDDTPEDGYPSDEDMRAAIEQATGKAPHWKCGRDTLIEKYDEAAQ